MIVRLKFQEALYSESDISKMDSSTLASSANAQLNKMRKLTQALMSADQYSRKNVPEYNLAKCFYDPELPISLSQM